MGLFANFEKELPRVDGKVFVITGTTSGTGHVAAATAARHGGEVLLLNRPSERSRASLEKLRAAVPDGTFVPIDCDLMDFGSVRAAARDVASRLGEDGAVYCLANNAGIMATDDRVTGDGYDEQVQTNHLSHFLLTAMLFPLILRGSEKHGDARVVTHSSSGRLMTEHQKLEERYFLKHEDGELGGDEIEGIMKGSPWLRYFQSKLANSVFNHALHDKLRASSNEDCKNILAVCCHPGSSRTNLSDHLFENEKAGFLKKYIFGPLFYNLISQSQEDGTMGLLKCMMDSTENIQSGALYGPELLVPKDPSKPPAFITEMKTKGLPVKNQEMNCETDQESKNMLWKVSEDATGVKFDI